MAQLEIAEHAEREFDVVVWGASGFTGRLVAEYLYEQYGAGASLRWALAGRNQRKLEKIREEISKQITTRETGDALDIPILIGDSADDASLESLVQRTRVICSTVGPYALYGSKLVASCARQGTHYCDLTGEVAWMREMIDAHESTAAESGAVIVHSCGFDCIPSDLGVHFLQEQMKARHGVPCSHIKYRVVDTRGGISGGTAASMMEMLEAASQDSRIRRIIADPYALDPKEGRAGRDGSDQVAPIHDEDFGEWTAPFLMAPINTRIVRRSNALAGYAYGSDFRYDEAMLMGAGPAGWAKAAAFTAGIGGMMALGAIGPLRRAMAGMIPQPGTGPSKQTRESGYFDIVLFGRHPQDERKNLRAHVTGDRDPGYGSTSKMLGESAVCLALDKLPVAGGFWTTATAMGGQLTERLQARAGLTFSILKS